MPPRRARDLDEREEQVVVLEHQPLGARLERDVIARARSSARLRNTQASTSLDSDPSAIDVAESPAQQPPVQQPPVQLEKEEEETCAICLDIIESSQGVPLSCGHRYHETCLIPWLQKGNRSCPTCRNKPPRERLGDDDSDEDGYSRGYESGYTNDEDDESGTSHQQLHDEWNQTWDAWVETLRESESLKRKAVSKAKALVVRKRVDSGERREAQRLVRQHQGWKSKLQKRKKDYDESEKQLRIAERQAQRDERQVWDEYYDDLAKLTRKRTSKLVQAVSNLSGFQRALLATRKATDQAQRKVRRVESELARMVGWSGPAPPPVVPDELRHCVAAPDLRNPADLL